MAKMAGWQPAGGLSADDFRGISASMKARMTEAQRIKALVEIARDKPGYRKAYVEQAYKFALLGLTVEQMADVFGVTIRSLKDWKEKYPAFREACAAGGIVADAEVAKALYQRAKGYKRKAVKVFMPQGAPAPVFAEYTDHMAPDVSAASMWLNNRQRGLWRQRIEHTGADGEPLMQMGEEQRLAWAAAVLSRIQSLEPLTIEHEGVAEDEGREE